MAKYVWIENKDTASNNRQLYKVIMQGDEIVGYEKVTKYPPCTIVDEDYVNRKIQEADPVFKGTFNTMADINAIGDANKNDWAYLRSTDSSGNVSYSRYRYTTEIGWIFEVAIKRDNFTDEEWAAITSGITSGDVAKLTALPTNTELTNALGEKADENYDDVYIGSGAAYSDAMVQANHHDNIRKGSLNSVTVSDTYLWVILPSPYIPTMQMEGVVIPMTRQTDVTVSDVTYNVFKSNVSYDGTFNVILL